MNRSIILSSWFLDGIERLFHLESFSSKDPDPAKAEYLLEEMKEFRQKLRQRTIQMEKYSHQHPIYSALNINSSILGDLSLQTSIDCMKYSIHDENDIEPIYLSEEEEDLVENESIESDRSEELIHELPPDEDEISSSSLQTLENIPNKKLLWSIHFKFVPQYISLYRQSILFASDRWGFVSTWTYTNARTKPIPKKSFVLFPQFRVGTWSRVYVESFSVCMYK